MKKIIKLCLCFMLLLTLCACQKSEFAGKYTLDSIIVGETVYKENDAGWKSILGANVPGKNIYIELKSDGSFSYVLSSDIKQGKWSEENNVIKMVTQGFEESATYKDGSLLFEKENNVSLLFLR